MLGLGWTTSGRPGRGSNLREAGMQSSLLLADLGSGAVVLLAKDYFYKLFYRELCSWIRVRWARLPGGQGAADAGRVCRLQEPRRVLFSEVRSRPVAAARNRVDGRSNSFFSEKNKWWDEQLSSDGYTRLVSTPSRALKYRSVLYNYVSHLYNTSMYFVEKYIYTCIYTCKYDVQ